MKRPEKGTREPEAKNNEITQLEPPREKRLNKGQASQELVGLKQKVDAQVPGEQKVGGVKKKKIAEKPPNAAAR